MREEREREEPSLNTQHHASNEKRKGYKRRGYKRRGYKRRVYSEIYTYMATDLTTRCFPKHKKRRQEKRI